MYLTSRAPLVMAIAALAVFAVPSSWVVLVWALVLAALVALDVALATKPADLRLTRGHIPAVRLGQSTTSTLTVTNTGSRAAHGQIRDAWTPGAGPEHEIHEFALVPSAAGDHAVTLTPTRRGWRPADVVTVRCRGPLGLAGRQRSFAVPAAVQVMPAFTSRKHLPSRLLQLREIEGRSLVRAPGQGTEFDSLRDYFRGDDVRSIDWRATARRRVPVVRTWRPERDRRVTIVLDTSRLTAGRLGDTTRLDAGIEAALLLAALAGQAGDTVEWLAGDRTIRAHVPPVHLRGTDVRPVMLAASTLEPALVEADWKKLTRPVSDARRSLLVLVTPFEPAAVEEGLLPLLPALARRHTVVIASPADPEVARMAQARSTVREVYGAAAAERMRSRREGLRASLGRMGVHVIDTAADDLPPALTDHYLALKREGRL